VLIVSNHSGGTTIPDVWGFGIAWYRHFGVERPLHFLAHEIIVGTELTGRYFGSRGVLRASRENAMRALRDAGHDLMTMPGGDLDVWRPHRDRYRLRFNGRTGYARLARAAGVKIVPVANAGAHDTLYVISDGQWLARAMQLHRVARADIWPIHLSLPWGLAVGPWPHIPLPTTLRYRVGPPIDVPAYEGDEEDAVRAIDTDVREAIQRMLDELRDERER
jgi:1-acyl-sn-glycerol-3-phosphate acyltransferase